MNRPYFHTWSKQSHAIEIEIDSIEDFSYKYKDRKYLDMSSVSFQASFGINNIAIKDAITKQLAQFAITSPKHTYPLKQNVTIKLLEDLNLDGKIFYTLSGAESIENALKIVRQYTGKEKVLAKKHSYHGATLGALSITGDWRNSPHKTIDEWTIRIPDHIEDPDAKLLEKIILQEGPSEIAAICLETMTGVNGVHKPTSKWFDKVQKLCHQYNIKLILDEVICGFGRTGKKFGFHHYPFLKPDIVCLSKAITGGYIPFGAVFISRKISQYYDKNILSCGLTNYAHPLGLAALSAVQEICDNPNFWKSLNLLENELDHFIKLNTSTEIKMRRFGLMMAIEHKKELLLDDFLDAGIYLICKPNFIVISPALTMPLDILKVGLEKILGVINAK